ncbi:MAG: Ig-like domain repeat protein [Thaumarchaeota archaeon]|nr:Ig-like domain repeat protein [Nitrososphaerota archaeon]
MKFKRSVWKRKAISGIVAGILFFALLFTAGVGLVLFVNDLVGKYQQAQQQYQSDTTQRNAEAAALSTSGTASIFVSVNNTGRVPFQIVGAFITNKSGSSVSGGSGVLPSPRVVPMNVEFNSSYPYSLDIWPGPSSVNISTGFSPESGAPYAVGIVTKAGNVFYARFPSQTPIGSAAHSPVLAEIVTTLNASFIFPGQSVFDQATLTGVTPAAGGTVTYNVWGLGEPCSSLTTPDASFIVPVTNGTVPPSPSRLFNNTGFYSWDAFYTGDLQNDNATSACEPLVVTATTGIITQVITTLSASVIVPPGSAFDQATLTGVTINAGGNLTYYYFADGTCGSGRTAVNQVAVSFGAAPRSDSVNFPLSGLYSWDAVYVGDSNNPGTFTSPCEPLLVTSSNILPALVTILSSSVITPGDSVYDQATLTGATKGAGGSVTFYYYASSGICLGLATQIGSPVGVLNGTVQGNSDPITFSASGSYSFYAVYSGDPNNNPATSACEPLLVSPKVVPGLVTTLSSNFLLPGGSVFDQATLIGVTSDAGGDVSYYRYVASGTCQGSRSLVSTSSVKSGKVDANSSAVGYPGAGSFSWAAVYSGDSNNNPSTSACEPLYVSPNFIRSITTTLSANVINPGDSVSDQANLTGVTTTAGGTVTYYRYSNGICTTGKTQVSQVTVTNAVVPKSGSFAFASAGTFSWSATYSGDGSNAGASSPCEPLLVEPRYVTQMVTTLSGSVVTPGTSVFDQASLSGVTTTAGGTVTYYRYSNGVCGSGQTQVGSVKSVSGGSAPISDTFTFGSSGVFSWNAVYSGDANNAGVTSPCEPLLVTNVNYIVSVITTLSSSSVVPSTAVYDQATLTGVTTSAGGTMTYYRFTDSACTTGQTQVGAVKTVASGIAPKSDSFTFTTAGSYSWDAVYSGDSNNAAATSACEPLTVSHTFIPAFTTTLSANVISPGGSVYDQASLEGVTSDAGGTVTYYRYTNGLCSTGQVTVATVAVTNGIAPSSSSATYPTAGSFSWKATYSGDANNNAANSPCEPLLVEAPPCGTSAVCSSSNSLTTQGIGFIGFNFDHFIVYDLGSCDVFSFSVAHQGCPSPLTTPSLATNQYSGYFVKPQQHFEVFIGLLTNVDPSGRTLILIPPTVTGVGGGSERSTGGAAFIEFAEPKTGGGTIAAWSYGLVVPVNETGSGGGSCPASGTCIEPLRTSGGVSLNRGGVALPPITCYDGAGGTGNIVACGSSTAVSFVTHPTWVYFAAAYQETANNAEPGAGGSSACTSPCAVGNFFYLQGIIGGNVYGQNIPFSITLWSTQTLTTTALSCSPSTQAHGSTVTCTATVTGTTPTGTVTFSTSQATGTTWSPTSATCTLALSGGVYKCSVTYTQSVAGTPTITASYTGDASNTASGVTSTVTFT